MCVLVGQQHWQHRTFIQKSMRRATHRPCPFLLDGVGHCLVTQTSELTEKLSAARLLMLSSHIYGAIEILQIIRHFEGTDIDRTRFCCIYLFILWHFTTALESDTGTVIIISRKECI